MNVNNYKYDYSQLGSYETKISEDIMYQLQLLHLKWIVTLYSMLTTYLGLPPSTKIQEFHCIRASNEIFLAKPYRRVSQRDSIIVYVIRTIKSF